MKTIFCDKWYLQAINLEKYLIPKGWVYVNSGKGRKVWRRGNVVLKIAYNESGVIANRSERYMYRYFKNDKVRYAPCRLILDNILMMTAVSPLDDLDPVQLSRIPKWALEMNDGPQVGVTNDGRILAYDYAEEDPRFNWGGNRAPIA